MIRPAEQICALCAYVRQRMNLVRYAASHIQHMQKALAKMNLLLTNKELRLNTGNILEIVKKYLAENFYFS